VVRALDPTGGIVSNASVSWSSLTPMIGTVDANGKLQGLALGTVTLKATTGEVEAMFPVEMLRLLAGLKVTPNPVPALSTYPVGETPLDPVHTSVQLQVKTVVSGGNEADYPVTWSTSDARLSLSASGLVTIKPGAEAGDAVVTARSVANPSIVQSVTIPVVRQGSLDLVIE
jgi:uncharacterized protein YjdB